MPKNDALTSKMITACEAYIRGLSMRAAMEKAGYTHEYCDCPAHVMHFLKTRAVVAYIKKRRDDIAAAANLDAAEVIKAVRQIVADNNPRDRVAAVSLLFRLGVPLPAPENITKDDIAGININIVATNLSDLLSLPPPIDVEKLP